MSRNKPAKLYVCSMPTELPSRFSPSSEEQVPRQYREGFQCQPMLSFITTWSHLTAFQEGWGSLVMSSQCIVLSQFTSSTFKTQLAWAVRSAHSSTNFHHAIHTKYQEIYLAKFLHSNYIVISISKHSCSLLNPTFTQSHFVL